MIGLAVLSYSMDEMMKMYAGIFLFSNPLGSYEQSNFSRLVAKLKLLITSQWIWIEKNPTVHLHYFIHRIRQNSQTNHFPFLHETFLVSFFQILEFEKPLMWRHHMTSLNEFHGRSLIRGMVWAKFHIPTGCGRCKNKGCQKIPN